MQKGIVKHKCLLEVSDDWKIWVVSKRNDLLVNHKSKNSHHSSTSVVKLDSTLLKLGLFIKVIPSEVNVSVTEVTNELVSGSWNITHEGALKESNEGNNLNKSSSWDGVWSDKSSNSVREGVEGITSVVDASWKVKSSSGYNLSEESKLTDTSVLDLNVTKAVESLLAAVTVEETERIEESKRRLSTKLVLESLQGGTGLGTLSWSESSS
mmetsp:Transcript_9678/g.14195  ORF Transcript_9678/g.14195 Transcript_9678/m.14195 type:complete len:210 (+) Transcript_9678:312-941(+)